MGIVAKQTIRGSIWSYLGVLMGFVTTTYLYTQYLTTEAIGLFGLLVAISTIASGLASLGMNGVTNRLFPYFRNSETGHNGYLITALIPQLIGFCLFVLFYFLYRDKLVENNIEKSALFAEYIYLIIPITFFLIIFGLLDNYIKLLYNAVIGTFLQEFFQRFLILITVVLYILKILTFHQLIIGYTVAISIKSVVILWYLWKKGELSLQPNFGFINLKLRKEMIDVALFSVIGGLGSMVVFNIDKIVINQLLNLSNTGIYTIALYFGTLVIIPSRPLLKISGTLIADAWATNNINEIKAIYYKSCITQFIIGGFLFLGIWANIDNILAILGPDYIQSKWVIFFVGIGYLFDMLTGANGHVIQFSKYYRVALVFIIFLVVVVLFLLYTLIPLWGITGAAIAIAAALFLNNLMRYVFLLKKYQMQPFNSKFLVVLAFYVVLYFGLTFFPQQSLGIDIIIRGTIIVIFSGIFFMVVPVSEDLINIRNKLLSVLTMKMNK